MSNGFCIDKSTITVYNNAKQIIANKNCLGIKCIQCIAHNSFPLKAKRCEAKDNPGLPEIEVRPAIIKVCKDYVEMFDIAYKSYISNESIFIRRNISIWIK